MTHRLAAALLLLVPAGCGDNDSFCPSGGEIALDSPVVDGSSLTNADDLDLEREGLQIDVPVSTDLDAGELTILRITSSADSGVTLYTAEVGDEGSATFAGVTLPYGEVTLEVIPKDGSCDPLATATVDVIRPDSQPPAILAIEVGAGIARDRILMSFTEPPGAIDGFVVKVSSEPLTDNNFNSVGFEVEAPEPGGPGTNHSLTVAGLRTGVPYYAAVATVDGEGTRSSAVTGGPGIPEFVASPVLTSPTSDSQGFGFKATSGDYNGDGIDDLAVSEPFTPDGPDRDGVVQVYFGAADVGIPSTPDVTIIGDGDAEDDFGQGLATMDWDGDGRDDLVISAGREDGLTGAIYVFRGQSIAGAPTQNGADFEISVDPTSVDLATSYLGYDLATLDFDGDGTLDLAASAPYINGFVVIYGGSLGDVALSEVSSANMGGAHAVYFQNLPGAVELARMANLGRTEGGADTSDDLGIADFDSDDFYVIRGRPQSGSTGLVELSFDAGVDLRVTDSGSGDLGTAAGSMPDQNGDGAREITVGSFSSSGNQGRVMILDGDTVGSETVAAEGDSTFGNFVLSELVAGPGIRLFGSSILTGRSLDDDGIEDLIIQGTIDGGAQLIFVIYGGEPLPAASAQIALIADHSFVLDSSLIGLPPANGDRPMFGSWVGDLNGDGAADLCLGDFAEAVATDSGTVQILY